MLPSHWSRARGQATLGTLSRAVIGPESGDILPLVESSASRDTGSDTEAWHPWLVMGGGEFALNI